MEINFQKRLLHEIGWRIKTPMTFMNETKSDEDTTYKD